MLIAGRDLIGLQTAFEEDTGIRHLAPYRSPRWKAVLYWTLCLLSLGTLYVLCRWYRRLEVCIRLSKSMHTDCSYVLITAVEGSLALLPVDIKLVPPYAFGPAPPLLPYPYKVPSMQTFMFRYERFYLHPDRLLWLPIRFPCLLSYRDIHNEFAKGIRQPEIVQARMELYGRSEIDVPIPPIFTILVNEVLNPFFLFQAFSISLWLYEQYRLYAFIILIMTLFSVTIAVIDIRQNAAKVRAIAVLPALAKVLRDYVNTGEPTACSGAELVPGDLIEILPNWKLPCDVILLNGSCVVNEGILTGESAPVLKDSLPSSSHTVYDPYKDKKYTISAGSMVLQVRKKTVGVVVATGFGTAKGRLIKSILFPRPNGFRFQQDSIKFVVVLGIVALIGAALSLKTFIEDEVPAKTMVVDSLDLITIAVPPALPLAMTVGISLAVSRLMRKGVTCISPQSLNAAGRISLVCFDKTGTLTEDAMDLIGLISAQQGDFSPLESNIKLCKSQELLICLSTCHSLSIIDGEISGDPMEKAIMSALEFTLEDGENRKVNCGFRSFEILQIYHFSSVTKRMGVVVLSENEQYLFVKGAPEEIKELCTGLPPSYSSAIAQYSKQGLRLLACCWKRLEGYRGTEGLGDLERGMELLGLVVLQNKLKPESVDVVKTLQGADIRSVISTGDNLMTALAVARESSLIPADLEVYCCDLPANSASLVWEKHTTSSSERLSAGKDLEWLQRLRGGEQYIGLAVTGNALEFLIKARRTHRNPILRFLLDNLVVCGRMSPSQKMLLIEEFQLQGHLTVMCGDGANDCGALKSADVGLSVSNAEASVAAPFTAASLLGLEMVLREGRAALTTSFQCFKFIGLYSMIQFVSVTTLFLMRSTLMDGQFLYIDLVTIIPLTFVMSNSQAYPRLVKEKPPGSLLSVPVLASMLGLTVLQLLLVGATVLALISQPWYESGGEGVDNPVPCYENSAVFLVSTTQYVSVAVAFSIGPPFRISAWRNWPFTITVAFILLLDIYMVLMPSEWLQDAISIVEFPTGFRFFLLFLMAVGSGITFLFEKFVVFRLERCEAAYVTMVSRKERAEELSACPEEL
jgi:cation-transporting ATPase 13A3/4/5